MAWLARPRWLGGTSDAETTEPAAGEGPAAPSGGDEQSLIVATPELFAGARVIASPFQYFMSGEDNLRIEGWNALSGVTVELRGRFFTVGESHVFPFAHRLTLTADRLRTRQDYAVGVGFLLNLLVIAVVGAPSIGQTFIRVSVVRGRDAAGVALGVVLQGYVTAEQGLGWPGSPIQSSLDQRGAWRRVAGTDPAAGAEISETVPTGARWEVLAFSAELTTSAVANNRRPQLRVTRGGAFVTVSVQSGVVPASDQAIFYWQPGMPLTSVIGSGASVAGLPMPFYLVSGDIVATATTSLDSADNWGAPQMMVAEWLEV